MENLIYSFPDHILSAVGYCKKLERGYLGHRREFKNVVVAGMGGSAIGARIVRDMFSKESYTPIDIVSDYEVPSSVGPDTLVVCSSYSGTTEETLYFLKIAFTRGASVVCISSNPNIVVNAKLDPRDIPVVHLPPDLPPRAAIGFSMVCLSYVFSYFDIIPRVDVLSRFSFTANELKKDVERIRELAYKNVDKIGSTCNMVAIYASTNLASVGTRFRQQLNENAKMFACDFVIPEANHNDLVGWTEHHINSCAVFIHSDKDFPKIGLRFEFTKKVIKKYVDDIVDINFVGPNLIFETLYAILYLDFISVRLAHIRGVDPMEVDIIGKLKAELK